MEVAGSGRGLVFGIMVSSEGTDGNHEQVQSGCSVSEPRLVLWTLQLRWRNAILSSPFMINTCGGVEMELARRGANLSCRWPRVVNFTPHLLYAVDRVLGSH